MSAAEDRGRLGVAMEQLFHSDVNQWEREECFQQLFSGLHHTAQASIMAESSHAMHTHTQSDTEACCKDPQSKAWPNTGICVLVQPLCCRGRTSPVLSDDWLLVVLAVSRLTASLLNDCCAAAAPLRGVTHKVAAFRYQSSVSEKMAQKMCCHFLMEVYVICH